MLLLFFSVCFKSFITFFSRPTKMTLKTAVRPGLQFQYLSRKWNNKSKSFSSLIYPTPPPRLCWFGQKLNSLPLRSPADQMSQPFGAFVRRFYRPSLSKQDTYLTSLLLSSFCLTAFASSLRKIHQLRYVLFFNKIKTELLLN